MKKKLSSPSISLNHLPQQTARLLHRYHVVIFSLVVVGGLAVAVFFLNGILQQASQAHVDQTTGTTFDVETIEQINQLRTRDQSGRDLDFPEGRINPFVE